MIARASGKGANTAMIKLRHNTTDDNPKRRSLAVDSCGACITSVFIPV
jgi:hypothetical protein